MSYLVILENDNAVKEIIKNPNKEQQKQGIVIDNLTDTEQFMEIENKLYLIKKGEI